MVLIALYDMHGHSALLLVYVLLFALFFNVTRPQHITSSFQKAD